MLHRADKTIVRLVQQAKKIRDEHRFDDARAIERIATALDGLPRALQEEVLEMCDRAASEVLADRAKADG